jgi:hypothetical protein
LKISQGQEKIKVINSVCLSKTGTSLRQARGILLAIHILDKAGHLLAKVSRCCADRRTTSKSRIIDISGKPYRKDSDNHEFVPPNSAKQVSCVEILIARKLGGIFDVDISDPRKALSDFQ